MSNESRLYDHMFNHNYCGFCQSEPCQCGGLRELNRIRDEENKERRVKEWEQEIEEALSYHNEEIDERYEFEAAHIHELDGTPGIRAPRSVLSRPTRPR